MSFTISGVGEVVEIRALETKGENKRVWRRLLKVAGGVGVIEFVIDETSALALADARGKMVEIMATFAPGMQGTLINVVESFEIISKTEHLRRELAAAEAIEARAKVNVSGAVAEHLSSLKPTANGQGKPAPFAGSRA